MPGTKVQAAEQVRRQPSRHLRPRFRQEPGRGGQDLHRRADQRHGSLLRTARGLTIVARYQEVGQGWSKKRNQFQKMLNDAKLGRFDTIVCWKSDRLSRGMYPAAALMEVVEASHVNLEAVMDSIDMKTFGLMAAIGKIELDNFRERASMGKRGAAKMGRIPVSNVPYGYRVGEDGRPEIVEEEAEVVRRIYRWCVDEGLGATVIRNRLTAEGALPGPGWQAVVGRPDSPHPDQRDLQGHLVVRHGPATSPPKTASRSTTRTPRTGSACPSRPSSTMRPGTVARRCGPSARPIRGATPRYFTCCSTWCAAPSAECSWAAWPPGSGR